MRTTALLGLLVAAPALIGCAGEGEGAGEAVGVFERFRDALRAEDYGAVFDLLSAEDVRRVELAAARLREDVARREADAEAAERVGKLAAAFGVSPEELAALPARELWIRGTAIRGDAAKLRGLAEAGLAEPPAIRGDVAVLRVRTARGPDEVLHLVREDGRWRVSLRRPPGVER